LRKLLEFCFENKIVRLQKIIWEVFVDLGFTGVVLQLGEEILGFFLLGGC
jgi:hypothetical protein